MRLFAISSHLSSTIQILLIGVLINAVTNNTYAFENTKVLPKGVRNLTIKTANTVIDNKTNSKGQVGSLAAPLEKQVTFADILKEENQLKQNQIKAMMNKEDFIESDLLGQTFADMQGNVTVTAPIISYGVSERLTLAVAVPYYKAHMAVDIDFKATDKAQQFLDGLGTNLTNQVASARSAGEKFNNAIASLNEKLIDNGFQALNDWRSSGIGDITLAAKYLALDHSVLKIASTSGVVLPTGKVDDPNNLIDIPFGDGTLDLFTSIIADQSIGAGFTINQYAKYTYQSPSFAKKRMETDDEKIEVESKAVHYKLGDKIETGSSVQFDGDSGFLAGVGAIYSKKFQDKFDATYIEVYDSINSDTAQEALHAESRIGYSSIPAFKRKEASIPMTATLEYKSHISSKNTPTNDLVTLDMAIFF